MMPLPLTCKVCRHPRRDEINEGLKNRRPFRELELIAGATRPTLTKHRREHLTPERELVIQDAKRDLDRQRKTLKGKVSPTDYLQSVVAVVAEGIETGRLMPNVNDGTKAAVALIAQAEKGADREWGLKMASILGGGWRPQIVEGEYREIDPEQIEDFEAVALLTAG